MSKRPTDRDAGSSQKKKSFLFSGLDESMRDPALIVYADDRIVIIKDKYPKARHHFLVLPKDLENVADLKALRGPRHVDLLKYMQCKGEEQAKRCESADALEFRYGYHAIPSMRHLHLHVISQDFDSPCLKTKRHWNSFTTAHFVDSSEVIRQLEENGRFTGITSEKSKKLLESELRCHKCEATFSTMPKLKAHIRGHVPP